MDFLLAASFRNVKYRKPRIEVGEPTSKQESYLIKIPYCFVRNYLPSEVLRMRKLLGFSWGILPVLIVF